MQSHWYENDVFVFTANETDYHKKGFALSLFLKGRVFRTQKWPVALKVVYSLVLHVMLPTFSFYCLNVREVQAKSVVIKIFWDGVFMVRNMVKTRQSWRSAVIWRKPSAFEMKFYFIVVSTFLKWYLKDDGDSLSRLLERSIWLVRKEALLFAVL